MASTRFYDDPARIQDRLRQSTFQDRYIHETPFNEPALAADPYVRVQGWGGNLYYDPIDVSSYLRGTTRQLTKSGMLTNRKAPPYQPTGWKTSNILSVDQSRTTLPAYEFRAVQQSRPDFPLHNPQAKLEIPFPNNQSSRLVERDYFTRKMEPCHFIHQNLDALLPIPLVETDHGARPATMSVAHI